MRYKKRMRLLRLAIGSALLCIHGCGSSNGGTEPASTAPELDECSPRWHAFAPHGTTYDTPTPGILRWQDGTLYYTRLDGARPFATDDWQLVALPESGGTPTVLISDPGPAGFDDFWIEDDHVLLARLDKLYQAPIAGGTPEVIADGHVLTNADPDAASRLGLPRNYALDHAYLYWETQPSADVNADVSIWRLSRAGDEDAEMLGTVSKNAAPLSKLVDLGAQLLVAGGDGYAYTLSKSDGRSRALSVPPNAIATTLLSGTGPGGVLWRISRATKKGGPLTSDLELSKLSGSKAVAFWPSKTDDIDPDRAWADNASSWIVNAAERFSDGARHASVWSVDDDGHASRLACNPHTDNDETGAAVLTPDAALIVIRHVEPVDAGHGESGPAWNIVRVGR